MMIIYLLLVYYLFFYNKLFVFSIYITLNIVSHLIIVIKYKFIRLLLFIHGSCILFYNMLGAGRLSKNHGPYERKQAGALIIPESAKKKETTLAIYFY